MKTECCQCVTQENERLKAELARVQRLPELEPMAARAEIMQVAATLARKGWGDLGIKLRDAVDKWSTWDARNPK